MRKIVKGNDFTLRMISSLSIPSMWRMRITPSSM
nr:MAG TPA: hypothetical protein [Caudoviricetes sp.]